MDYSYNGGAATFVVNPVDQAVGSAAGAISVVQRWPESFPDAVRVVEQRAPESGMTGQSFGPPRRSCSRRMSACPQCWASSRNTCR